MNTPSPAVERLRHQVARMRTQRDRARDELADAGDTVRQLRDRLAHAEQEIAELQRERDAARAEAERHLEHLRTAHPAHFTPNVLGERLCGCGGQWPCPAERDELEQARAALDRVREYVGGDLALTNAEMTDLHRLEGDPAHVACGPVWQGYFLRMVGAAIDGSGT